MLGLAGWNIFEPGSLWSGDFFFLGGIERTCGEAVVDDKRIIFAKSPSKQIDEVRWRIGILNRGK